MYFLGIFPLGGLTAIILLIIVKVVILRRKGISVKSQQPTDFVTLFLLYPAFLLLLTGWLASLIEETFFSGNSFLPTKLTGKLINHSVLEAAGAGFIVLAVILMYTTLLHFRSSLRFGMSINNKGKLITSGIFSHSRNPFFLSLNFYFIGQALVFPGIVFIGMAVLACLGIHFFILREEKFLEKCYGDEYIDYKRRVRRYF